VAPAIVNAVADALGYDFHSMPLDAECLLEIEGCES
jgi:CO/xanthine dehydrogenase Mo-binding subunit